MITLYTRSYAKDFGWLRYSILSMKKYLTGVDYKVLQVPVEEIPPPEAFEFYDKIVFSNYPSNLNGYITQQLDKLQAYNYTDDPYIIHSDSDCIYTGPFHAPSLMLDPDNRPILYMTNYDLLPPQGAHWQAIVYRYLKITPKYEFMRAFPIIHRTDTQRLLLAHYPQLINNALGITDREFSEFNMLGAYAYEHSHPYHFTEEQADLPCKQFWSWGGLTDSVLEEIHSILL